VGKGFVLQGVNNAIQIWSLAGVPQLPKVISSNELYGVTPAIDRATGINGVYPTDMRVFFDDQIERWFVLQRAQEYNIFGDPIDRSRFYLAVSRTDDPRGDYFIYEMDTTDLANPGCPCVADYPQIGADEYGFYISSNEFHAATERFVNAQIHAISKASLADGSPVPTVYRFQLPFATGYEFAIEPARTPPGASNFLASGGLVWFASTNGRAAIDNKVAIWALFNTASLRTGNPFLTLTRVDIETQTYFYPDVATQKPGPTPYGSSLIPPRPLSFLDGGDTRVQSVAWAGGRLYVTMATDVADEDGRTSIGTAYFIFLPTFRAGQVAATLSRQGVLRVSRNHILRPSLMVNAQGKGAIAATLVGPDYHPSAALIPFDLAATPTNLQIVAAGQRPQDGFTAYAGTFGPGVARWGDYSTAVLAADGSVWMTAQFIPNAPVAGFANWGTYLYKYLP
jgi:hypothetical protein